MSIFVKNRTYTIEDIVAICDINNLITVDCLKDENMISVEEADADCLYEFHRQPDGQFILTWAEE